MHNRICTRRRYSLLPVRWSSSKGPRTRGVSWNATWRHWFTCSTLAPTTIGTNNSLKINRMLSAWNTRDSRNCWTTIALGTTYRRAGLTLPRSGGLERSKYHHFMTNWLLAHVCMWWSVVVVVSLDSLGIFLHLIIIVAVIFYFKKCIWIALLSYCSMLYYSSKETVHWHITYLMELYFMEYWNFLL